MGASSEQRRQFEEKGYVIIDDPAPPDWIDPVVADMEPLYRKEPPGGELERNEDGVVFNRHPKKGGERYWHRVRNAWKVSDNVRRLALAPRVLEVIAELHGGPPARASQTLNFALGTQQPAHSDSFEFQPDPPGLMCGVWVALEDMDMENGPLFYHPGSHKLPLPSWDRIHEVLGTEINRADYADDAEFIAARRRAQRQFFTKLAEESGEPEYATIRKGQALVWASNLLHGGSFQQDKSRTRHSQVMHYFFGDARVFAWMSRVGDRIHWDYPEWVRDPVPVYSPQLLGEAIAANVPAGEAALVATHQPLDALPVEGRRLAAFPVGSEPAQLPNGEARYLVFAKETLGWLEHEQTELQDVLESRHRPLLRDGAVAAIYELSS
jgi:ectoine hydroxylase-related dioxygenase (phytanoyl-CoA dioxygenase family)